MSAQRRLAGGILNTPPGPRSGDAEFQAACERQDYALLQDALRDMTKRDACRHLAALFPRHSARWFQRHLGRLSALTSDDFARLLTYLDPTGDEAVSHVVDERGAA